PLFSRGLLMRNQLFALAMIAHPAWAEVQTINNGFWRSQIDNEQRLILMPQSQRVESDCAEYSETVRSHRLDRDAIDVLRQLDTQVTAMPYQTRFEVNYELSEPQFSASLAQNRQGGAEAFPFEWM